VKLKEAIEKLKRFVLLPKSVVFQGRHKRGYSREGGNPVLKELNSCFCRNDMLNYKMTFPGRKFFMQILQQLFSKKAENKFRG